MVLEKFIEGITNQDLVLLESLLHEDMGALEVTMKKDGHLIRFSNVFLYKDNKIYRHLINVVTDHFTE